MLAVVDLPVFPAPVGPGDLIARGHVENVRYQLK